MHNCPECGHLVYWHEQRREDEPSLFVRGVCLCGCEYMKITTYTVDDEGAVRHG